MYIAVLTTKLLSVVVCLVFIANLTCGEEMGTTETIPQSTSPEPENITVSTTTLKNPVGEAFTGKLDVTNSSKTKNPVGETFTGKLPDKKSTGSDISTNTTTNLTTPKLPDGYHEISNVDILQTTLVSTVDQLSTNDAPIRSSNTSTSKRTTTIITTSNDNCPSLEGDPDKMDTLTQEQITSKLTHSCRYDRLIKPQTENALEVYIRMNVRHMESLEQLQFKSHLLVQLRYTDNRLNYGHISPNRRVIVGEEPLREKIWVPHIILKNDRDTSLMGLDAKDVFVSITPQGNIIYSFRMTATFYCWMNLRKFPFDSQVCEITWASWAYDTSNLLLKWEGDKPFEVAANLHLTEFSLDSAWTERSFVPAPFSNGGKDKGGNYSQVNFKFKLTREVGFYIMDYFLPSMLLVIMSWVSFWLQADAAPPRVVLGTSTMLSFITLNGGVTKNLPKVSYIKASEIWFLGCACFIFCSLAEFAFVNVIWRRRKLVELKKPNSKYILKGAVSPRLARKDLRKAESTGALFRARSCSSLDTTENGQSHTQSNYLTVHSFPSSLTVPTITTQSQDELMRNERHSGASINVPESGPPTPTWASMTPQEVANWIDKRARIVFPVCFIIFNIMYWSFVYAL